MLGPSLGEASGCGMGLEEQAIDAQGHGGPGQGLDHGPIAAGGGPQSARLLHAVGGVEDHRHAQGLHLRDGPHVVDQPAVAEEGAPLAQHDVAAAGRLELAHDVFHVPGGQELALFHVDCPAGAAAAAASRSVCRARKAGICSRSHTGRRAPPARANGCRSSPAARSPPSPAAGYPVRGPARAPIRTRRWCGWPCRTRP